MKIHKDSSTNEWINKYVIVIKEILFSHEKELSIGICYNMDNLENLMLSERSQKEKSTHFDCVYMKCTNRQIYRDRKYISGSQGLGE